jgi:hypothetical protein
MSAELKYSDDIEKTIEWVLTGNQLGQTFIRQDQIKLYGKCMLQ